MLRIIIAKLRIYRVLQIAKTWLFHASGNLIGFPRLRFYCPTCERKVYQWLPFRRSVGCGRTQLEPRGRQCPHCESFERTRHFALYLDKNGVLDSKPRMLHFAPEKGLALKIRPALGDNYVTSDLSMPDADRNDDITEMNIESNSFDFIYCSNVLEHVEDDSAAMAELFRVLAPGGTAIVQVPIKGAITHEDSSIIDPAERLEHFGQSDHVRFYGEDIRERLSKVGFEVTPFCILDVLSVKDEDVERMNLGKRELIHKCSKPK